MRDISLCGRENQMPRFIKGILMSISLAVVIGCGGGRAAKDTSGRLLFHTKYFH